MPSSVMGAANINVARTNAPARGPSGAAIAVTRSRIHGATAMRTAAAARMQNSTFALGARSDHLPPSQYPSASALSVTAMSAAQAYESASSDGAASRAP